ncbi:Protein kinase, putative [Hondaea fermentalgiana]|uniref:Protein kinase, putative n=1 Tax=Hondaea fermentalgiana TaxID=2315210 RepID=A0A2R5GD11_9STRA|nr:Protein kinase, putative [Hondaea fermentalgiana]|eukprot:GBG27588.1 Protein kinase, putative [Hondaea fermentalgiana]
MERLGKAEERLGGVGTELEDCARSVRKGQRPAEGASLISERVTLEELNARYQLQAVTSKGKSKEGIQHEFDKEGSLPARFLLGSGAYGQVVKAKDSAGRPVAIKVVNRQAMALDSLQNEIEALTLARRHPNVTELIEVLFCPESDRYYLVTEFCGGGELFDRLIDKGPYNEFEAAKLVERVASALNYLHQCGFAHMDVKPENLMFSGVQGRRDGDIRLIDFGMCKRLDSFKEQGVTHMTSNVGTTPYLPSEILLQLEAERRPHLRSNGGPLAGSKAQESGVAQAGGVAGGVAGGISTNSIARGGVGIGVGVGVGGGEAEKKNARKRKVDIELLSDPRACDMWSLGIIIYILLLGCHPFDRSGDAEDDEIAARAVLGSDTSDDDPKASPPRFTFDVHRRVQLSADAKDLITRLLDPNPATRLRSHEVIKHPWLQRARRVGLSQHRSLMSKWHEGKASKDLRGNTAVKVGQALERDTLAHRAVSSAMLVASLAARKEIDPQAVSGRDAQSVSKAGTTQDVARMSDKEANLAARDQFFKESYSVLRAANWGEELTGSVDVLSLSFDDFVRSVKREHSFKYSSGETIFQGGDDAEGIFILLSGQAQVEYNAESAQAGSPARHVVSELQPGDVFGEAAILDGRDFRNATVRCLTPVRVLFWSRDDFVRVMCGTNALCLGLEEHLRHRQNMRARRLLELLDPSAFETYVVKAGESLYNEGDLPDALYVVESGVIRTWIDPRRSQGGRDNGGDDRLHDMRPVARVKGAAQRFLTRMQEKVQITRSKPENSKANDLVPLREYHEGALVGTDALASSARISTATCVNDVTVTRVERAKLAHLAAQESSLHNTMLRLSRRDNEEKLARLRAASTSVFRDFEASAKPSELSDLVKAVERQLLRRQSMQFLPSKGSA